MKQLSIEQKARLYDEAIERAQEAVDDGMVSQNFVDDIFPELKESEDEKIRKALLEMVHDTTGDELWIDYNIHKEEALAWIEKQSKTSLEKQQKALKVEETMRDIEQKAKAFTEANEGLTSDEILANMRGEGLSENKPVDKIEPKFKVGDIIKPKDKGHEPWQIMQVDILNKEYRFKDGYVIHFSQEDAYELVDKKFTAWNEEDESHVKSILSTIECCKTQFPNAQAVVEAYNADIEWLKSLKDRVQPQPKQEWSDEDEERLQSCLNCVLNKNIDADTRLVLDSPYQDLLKL